MSSTSITRVWSTAAVACSSSGQLQRLHVRAAAAARLLLLTAWRVAAMTAAARLQLPCRWGTAGPLARMARSCEAGQYKRRASQPTAPTSLQSTYSHVLSCPHSHLALSLAALSQLAAIRRRHATMKLCISACLLLLLLGCLAVASAASPAGGAAAGPRRMGRCVTARTFAVELGVAAVAITRSCLMLRRHGVRAGGHAA